MIFRVVSDAAAVLLAVGLSFVEVSAQSVEERLAAIETQNQQLREQLREQKNTIEQLQERLDAKDGNASTPALSKSGRSMNFGPLHISAEGGAAFFQSGDTGQYPNGSFRLDEAKLFLESPVWQDTYFFGELDLVTREANDEFFHLGELYIDFENVLRHWTDKNWLSLRVGRVDIPFGEEYLARDVIGNPLISHSLSDLWGVDEGVELYGRIQGFDYVLAVQNGSHPTLRDFTGDKSVAGRIGYNFSPRARVSFSGMRTGELSATDDKMSELWFGNGFFRSIGGPATTSRFEAKLFELDARTFWKSGHLKLAAGYFDYNDNDSAAENTREGYYYYAEAVQKLLPKFYLAGRFSEIHIGDGAPIVGQGNFGKYFFGPLTREVWRLSLGLGYRLSENLVAKLEYSLEPGELTNGAKRGQNNFFGAELGFKF